MKAKVRRFLGWSRIGYDFWESRFIGWRVSYDCRRLRVAGAGGWGTSKSFFTRQLAA